MYQILPDHLYVGELVRMTRVRSEDLHVKGSFWWPADIEGGPLRPQKAVRFLSLREKERLWPLALVSLKCARIKSRAVDGIYTTVYIQMNKRNYHREQDKHEARQQIPPGKKESKNR